MIWIKRLIFMVQFMTRIPVPINLRITNEDISWSMIFCPISGIIIGLVMLGGYLLGTITQFELFPILLVLVFQAAVTGALHIDGLADTFDGLFSNREKARVLDIMRDSRIGTNGSIAVIFDILVKLFVLLEIFDSVNTTHKIFIILALPVMGKIGILTAAGLSCYARSGEGLGKTFIDGTGTTQWIVGLLIGIIPLFFFFGVAALLHVFSVIIAAYILTKIVESKIQGMTGDTLGATNEICEIVFLTLFLVIQRIV